MAFTLPGNRIWEWQTLLTVAASPLLSSATAGWFDTTGYTNVLPSYKFTSGTTVITAEGSFDGSTLDADLTTLYGAFPASGTSFPVLSPWFRIRIVQSVADATVTKVFLQARQ
jgi:hypothetical protein